MNRSESVAADGPRAIVRYEAGLGLVLTVDRWVSGEPILFEQAESIEWAMEHLPEFAERAAAELAEVARRWEIRARRAGQRGVQEPLALEVAR